MVMAKVSSKIFKIVCRRSRPTVSSTPYWCSPKARSTWDCKRFTASSRGPFPADQVKAHATPGGVPGEFLKLCHRVIDHSALSAIITDDTKNRQIQTRLTNLCLKPFAGSDTGLIGEHFRNDNPFALLKLRQNQVRVAFDKEQLCVLH